MNLRLTLKRSRLIVAGATLATLWIAGTGAQRVHAQQRAQATPSPADKALMSDQAFKNVQVLKGMPVDDFMGTMGIMSAAVGFDCSECHIGAGTETVDWAADSPKKIRARQMTVMVQNINKQNFGGRTVITCWTCHRGRDRPAQTPQLAQVYGTPNLDPDDVLTQEQGLPEPKTIIDKYLNAIGGEQRWAAIKSWDATGTSVGFGGFGGGGKVEIASKFPDEHAVIIKFAAETGRGEAIRTTNGKQAWIKSPLTVLGEYEVSGGDLDGAKLDAELAFPNQMKTALTNLRTSIPLTISDLPAPDSQSSVQSTQMQGKDKEVNVVQGEGPNRMLCTLYFDKDTNLLLRVVRFGRTNIGRVPTQIDYADYRDVNGVKIPFRITFAWLDGRDAIQLSEVKLNVPIDETKFGRPDPAQPGAKK